MIDKMADTEDAPLIRDTIMMPVIVAATDPLLAMVARNEPAPRRVAETALVATTRPNMDPDPLSAPTKEDWPDTPDCKFPIAPMSAVNDDAPVTELAIEADPEISAATTAVPVIAVDIDPMPPRTATTEADAVTPALMSEDWTSLAVTDDVPLIAHAIDADPVNVATTAPTPVIDAAKDPVPDSVPVTAADPEMDAAAEPAPVSVHVT